MGCSRRSGLELPSPWGFAVLNDRPVACQTREPTDPRGDRWREALTDEVSLRASPQTGVAIYF